MGHLIPRDDLPSDKYVSLVLAYNNLELTDDLQRKITGLYKQGHSFVSAANWLKIYIDGPKHFKPTPPQ